MLILILEKNGKVRKTNIAGPLDESQLFLKAGKVKSDGFGCKGIIQKETFSIKLFGKLEGRKGQDHFVENIRFFGPVVLVAIDLELKHIDLPVAKWIGVTSAGEEGGGGDDEMMNISVPPLIEIKKRKRAVGVAKPKPEIKVYVWKPELEQEDYI